MCSSSSLPSPERCWTNVPTGQRGAISSYWLSSVITGLSASPQASQYILTKEQDEHSHTHTYIHKWEGSRQAGEESHPTGCAGLTVWDRGNLALALTSLLLYLVPCVWLQDGWLDFICIALSLGILSVPFRMTEFRGWTHWSPAVPSNACGSANFILVSFIFWLFLHSPRLCANCPIFCRQIHSGTVMNMWFTPSVDKTTFVYLCYVCYNVTENQKASCGLRAYFTRKLVGKQDVQLRGTVFSLLPYTPKHRTVP